MTESRKPRRIVVFDEKGLSSKNGQKKIKSFKFKTGEHVQIDKEFEELEQENFFENDENRIIIQWKNPEGKEIPEEERKAAVIEGFDLHTRELGLIKMRRTIFKYLLYKYGYNEKQKFISEYLKKTLKEDHSVILKIIELKNSKIITSQLESLKDRNIINELEQLVIEVFIEEHFNEKKEQKHEDGIENLDQRNIFLKFISILVGNLKSNLEFEVVPTFHNNFKTNEKYSNNIFKVIIKHCMKIYGVSDFGKNFYLFCLENKINLIEHIKDNHLDEKKKKIKENYLNIAKGNNNDNNLQPLEKIIDDLFALSFFSNSNINSQQYLRLPLYRIIGMYYVNKSEKKNCISYFNLIAKKNITTKEQEQEFKKECSLLNPTIHILHSHYNENLSNLFRADKDKIIFNFSETKFEELMKELKEIDEEIKKKYKRIIILLVEMEIESQIITLIHDIKDNESLLKKLEEKTKETFINIVTSLKNKNIFEFKEKNIENIIEEDILKNKTLFPFIKKTEDTLSDIIHSLIINNKTFPNFINNVQISNDLKCQIIVKMEIFLKNDYMKIIICKLLEEDKSETNIKNNNKILQNLYFSFEKNILKLNLLFNIYKYANSLVEKDLIHNIGTGEEGSILIPIRDNDNANKDSIFVKEFARLVAQVRKINSLFDLIKTIYADSKFKDNFIKLFEYCNEFTSKCGFMTNYFLELEICYLTIKLFNKEMFEQQEGSKEYLDKLQTDKFETNLMNDTTNFFCKDKNFKLLIEFARIILYKYSNKSDDVANNIFNYISKLENPFEGMSLLQQIIEVIIPLNLNYDQNFYTFSFKKELKDNFLTEKYKNLKLLKIAIEKTRSKNAKTELTYQSKRILLIHCFEKILLKLISKRNIKIFSQDWFKETFKNCMNLIDDYNEKLVDESTIHDVSLEHYFSIAFVKLFAHVYIDVLIQNKDNTSYFLFANDYFSENFEKISVLILQYYILKLIRNNYCDSFREFRNFNFSEYQILWVSNFKFNGKYKTEFEYLFFSNWNIYEKEKNSQESNFTYFDEYNTFYEKVFVPLKNENFRTSSYDQKIKQTIIKQKEMYIDIIMNVILSNTWNKDYISKMEYVEFCSWSKHIIMSINIINMEFKNYITLLSINVPNTINQGYQQILNLLNPNNEGDINIIELEIILIALKFALAFIIEKVSLLRREEPEKQTANPNQYELIKQLEGFIINSYLFYKNITKEMSQRLIHDFKKLQELLRMNNIYQIKLFCNFCYYLIRITPNQPLFFIIESAIQQWPNQGPFIQTYYKFTLYNQEKIRNLLLDERLEQEALINNICSPDNSSLKIPVFTYFFYENIPTWDHFINTFNQKNEIKKENYPYINFFKDPNNYQLYQEPLKSNKISQILCAKDKKYKNKKFYEFKYSRFKSLDDLSSFYSKSYIFYKECNIHLAYKIDYDIDSIEKELSSIEYADITSE